MSKGLVYVFTGEGKGKTSAALGVATRAALIGKKVVWISFYKGKDWDLAEKGLPDKFPNLEMHWIGRGFMIQDSRFMKGNAKIAKVAGGRGVVVDTASESEHKSAAEEGLTLAESKLAEKPWLLVLDEVMNAIAEGLLEEKQVLELLNERGETHLVLTGRGATEQIIKMADLVTECKKIKHPYDTGKLAVRGLDF